MLEKNTRRCKQNIRIGDRRGINRNGRGTSILIPYVVHLKKIVCMTAESRVTGLLPFFQLPTNSALSNIRARTSPFLFI
jgi:hypothetical protein